MATVEQDKNPASEQEYEDVTAAEHDYETLTRENTGYAKLSDLKLLDSGSFENPEVLDKHPWQHDRPKIRLPLNEVQDPPQVLVTPVDSCEGCPLKSKDIDEVVTFQRKLTSPTIMLYSESESEDEDVSSGPIEQNRTERAESDTINILGSLCLQGVMQGLVEQDTERRILPDSIRMTVNLEEHCAALDQLSVMVTKNLEIVPETPFDPNTRQRESSSSHSALFRRFRAKTQLSERPHSAAAASKIEVHVTNVTYIDYIVRPQPLPPLSDKLPLTERKRYKVVESLLESEAAFLTSLNIAIELYKKPLKETANTVLTDDQIKHLFGPIVPILEHHELFFSALSEQTKDWSPAKRIGNSFLASFNRKDVLKHYSKYVNNFSKAMSILEKAIKKRHKFYDFLKQQMTVTATPLSLQALLLKPIQRFPQYILFLKDLIKYTPSSHPDCVVLQMAYAHIEGIANSLNEAKHRSEQLTILWYLNSKIEKLSVNLVKTNQTLVRQDIIQWMHCKDGKWTSKERHLFLFNKILICCAIHQNKKARNDPERRTSRIEAEQVIGGDTSSTSLVCKWYCPIESLEMSDPDYIRDKTPLVTVGSEDSEIQTKFEELQEEMKKLDSDFQLLSKIGGLVASLHDTYESLSAQSIQNYCRILQRKLEGGHELMRSCEPCRVDITIPGKGNNSMSRYHHVLLFESEAARQNWVSDIQMAKLRQNKGNQQPWISNEDNTDDIDDEDEDDLEGEGTLEKYVVSDNLPLVIDYMNLYHNSEVSSVESATSVGSNRVWFATGNATSSYISIVRCFLPTPILVETFPVSSNKILCMKTIPTTTDGVLTVWMGSQCGKLMLYDATTKKCLQAVQLPDSILCIENYKNRVFIGTANGQLFVYHRNKGSQWDLKQCIHQIPVATSAIQCFCIVDDFLWMGIQKSCVLINTSSLQLEHGVKVTNDDNMCVKRLEKSGAGVWVALSRGATLYLYHKDTRKPIQEIDIQGSLANIIGYANIGNKFGSLPSLHITALVAAAGYLWVGSSVGATLIYRIPYIHGLPLLNGRPFLASDGHKGTVRVLTAVQTNVDVSSVRFDQFVSDERERMIGSFTNKSSQPLEEVSTGETNLIQSTAIDNRALPRVSQVIQKLELGKQLLKSSVHDQSLEAQDMSSLPKPVIKKAVLAKPVPKPRTKKPKKKIVPNITPADYETPQNLLDNLTQEDPEHVYDEVPFEYDESDEEETIERSSSLSEVTIDRSRYEGNTIQFGDSLYEHIGLNTISMTIPDQQVNQEQSTMFVFTGGTGLVDFRHGEPSSSQQKSQLIMSLNDPSHLNEVPCVITYQVPK